MVAGPQVSGTFSLKSQSPARYPGGELYPSPTASLNLGPLIYWNEAIPGGNVDASFTLGGTPFSFTGIGGHDRNFAPFIWDFIAQHWYWLRFVVGPYTLVFWIWTSAIDGKTYTTAFLSENGVEIFATRNGAISSDGRYGTLALLYGGKIHGSFDDMSTGFAVDLVDQTCDKKWHFELQHKNIAFEAPAGSNNNYSRFVNSASGGEVGKKVWLGAANSEQNVIPAPRPLP